MAFANLSVLAFGSLLMGLPILLHLMMKQRPRHQVFPAFRFLHRRQVANQRQLRLRHWLLLAVRLVVVGLIAALLSRPSVDSLQLGYWVKAILLAVARSSGGADKRVLLDGEQERPIALGRTVGDGRAPVVPLLPRLPGDLFSIRFWHR